jgi:hypothetical protein
LAPETCSSVCGTTCPPWATLTWATGQPASPGWLASPAPWSPELRSAAEVAASAPVLSWPPSASGAPALVAGIDAGPHAAKASTSAVPTSQDSDRDGMGFPWPAGGSAPSWYGRRTRRDKVYLRSRSGHPGRTSPWIWGLQNEQSIPSSITVAASLP